MQSSAAIEAQLEQIVANAPEDGNAARAIAEAVVPVLRQFAQQLHHTEYYVLQNLEREWSLVTMSSRLQPGKTKAAVQAFAEREDAMRSRPNADVQTIALPVPVVEVLWRLTGLKQVDSALFFEHPGNLQKGTEVFRTRLEAAIQAQLQQWHAAQTPPDPVPPTIA